MSKEDIDLAWLTGLLHDIGRFEQVRRYGTFNDAKSIDHGKLGVEILFLEGKIDNVISAKAMLFPDAYVCSGVTDNEFRSRYFDQCEKNRAFISTLIKGSIEEKILKLQEAKKNLADEVLNGENGTLNNMSKEELLELLS